MIETSILAWLKFAGLIGIATFAGVSLARLMRWNSPASEAGFVWATGVVLSPFLAGIAAVLALLLFPQGNPDTHLLFTGILLTITACLYRAGTKPLPCSKPVSDWIMRLLQLLLLVWLAALFCNSVFLPLTQNDPLEYATVGRLLYQARTLDIYPVLDTVNNPSGFFGPWTHPPLYVSLIYLTSAIQGHANAPGLMRLIAPWFLLCSTMGVVALARLQKSSFSLLAGILFVSTPMLFLGADSAQIDPLPTNAIVLLMLMLTGLNQRGIALGCWLGLALGLGMWTHSQAILLIPMLAAALLLLRGLLQWRQALLEFAVALGMAMLIAGYPYWKNLLIFGSPISDNPAVFALKSLDWQGYFRYARGLNTGPALVQYGIFKGWFVPEAYGLNFWLMTLGAILLVWRTGIKKSGEGLLHGIAQYTPEMTMLWLALGLVLTYLAGVVLSVLAGIDLMVRNERYLLIIMPAVALCASYGISGLVQKEDGPVNWYSPSIKRRRTILLAAIGGFFALAQLAAVGYYYNWRSISTSSQLPVTASENRLERILNMTSAFDLMARMPDLVPAQALVLTMRPADMYYSGRKMVSYLDPAMLPVYLEKSAAAVHKHLKALGINYVHSVDYTLPPMSNSFIQDVLASPELSTMKYSSGMYQLYSLDDSGLREGTTVNITPGFIPWTTGYKVHFVPDKYLPLLGLNAKTLDNNASIVSSQRLFNRDYSVLTQSGLDAHNQQKQLQSLTPVNPDSEYVVKLTIKGRGFVRLWITQLDADGMAIKAQGSGVSPYMRMGELSLSERYPQQRFLRRFKTLAGAKYVRFGIEQQGQSQVQIVQASLVSLTRSTS
ncbi:hypothetical protein [Legionella sp. CNM-4043-24]|uniref:hypothetical protein n=1 Tax=Legionella sp. CNM-4043-24 TaxID=3421646 RepID=UPI00403A9C79